MKLANVEYIGQSVVNDCYLLESISDVLEYVSIASELTMRDLRLSSRVPIHRWDHIYRQGSLWLVAIEMAKLKNVSIAHAITDHIETLTRNLFRYVETTRVVVQPSGGYCPEDSGLNVLSEEPYSYKCQTHSITEDSEYLVLENDPELDDTAKRWLQGKPFSYVLNLRSYKSSELGEVMREFQGHTLYVATTGIDAQQMDSYLNVASESGLTNLVVEWTSPPTHEALAVVEKYGATIIKENP